MTWLSADFPSFIPVFNVPAENYARLRGSLEQAGEAQLQEAARLGPLLVPPRGVSVGRAQPRGLPALQGGEHLLQGARAAHPPGFWVKSFPGLWVLAVRSVSLSGAVPDRLQRGWAVDLALLSWLFLPLLPCRAERWQLPSGQPQGCAAWAALPGEILPLRVVLY